MAGEFVYCWIVGNVEVRDALFDVCSILLLLLLLLKKNGDDDNGGWARESK